MAVSCPSKSEEQSRAARSHSSSNSNMRCSSCKLAGSRVVVPAICWFSALIGCDDGSSGLCTASTVASCDRYPICDVFLVRAASRLVPPVQMSNEQHNRDYYSRECQESDDGEPHGLPSQGTTSPHFGQRKPFKLPSKLLVLIRFRSIQNRQPQSGQDSR
jgi:hypothetical protein